MSSLLVTVSLFGFVSVQSWWLLLGCAVLLGMGGGAIDAGLNAYAAAHFNTRHMNWLHAFYGFGAMLGPLVMTFILSSGHPWQWGYALVGGILAVMAVCFALTVNLWQSNPAPAPAAEPASATTTSKGGAVAALKQPLVWLGILLFFVYTGLEVTTGQWSYTLFTEGRGINLDIAGVWVSIYWGSLTVGRLVFGLVTERFGTRAILRACMGAILVGTLLLWLNITPLLSFLGLALIGFMLAPIFPLLMLQTPARLGPTTATYAIGFQVAAANLGSSLVPGFAGVLTRWTGLEVIGPFLLVIAIILLLLHEMLLGTEKEPEHAALAVASE
jgi:fucose permease